MKLVNLNKEYCFAKLVVPTFSSPELEKIYKMVSQKAMELAYGARNEH